VAPDEVGRFYSGFLAQTHAHKRAWLILSSREVVRFDAIIAWTSEHRMAAFTVYGCIFIYMFVRQ